MFLSILMAASFTTAQCSGPECAVQGGAYAWRELPSDPGRSYLYLGENQVGGFDHATREYRPLLDWKRNRWGSPTTPPIEPPETTGQAPLTEPMNFGVDLSKIPKEKTYELNGDHSCKDHVMEAIHAKLPDDKSQLRLTLIGSKEDRDRVLKDLKNPENVGIAAKTVVWSVPPDHWSVRDNATGKPMFKTDGKPSVYLTTPSGKVLLRQDEFKGPETFKAIRRAVEGYDSKRDPTGNSPILDELGKLPPVVWYALGGLAFLFVLPKGGS